LEKFSWLSDQGARILINHLQDGIFAAEKEKLVYVNHRLAEILGYKINTLLGSNFIDLIVEEDRSLVLERRSARISGETVPEQYEIRLLTAQGALIFCSLNVGLRKDENGQITTVGSIRDITLQKSELSNLEASQFELQSIFDNLPDIFYRTNLQGIIIMISPSCFEILGYRQEVMLGSPMENYYTSPDERQKIVQAIKDNHGKATQVQASINHKDGSIVWISTNAAVRLDKDGNPIYIEGVARDITARKLMEEQLTQLTRIDGLTGVYNRTFFMNKSNEVLSFMKRYQRPASMMMMDLDHFKTINDTHGHHIGDLALIAFTLGCQKEIRESDIMGRLGGEEFGLMLPETSIENAQKLAERILLRIEAIEIPVAELILKITVSIGLVEINTNIHTLDDALRIADRAMYQAKDKGRNQVVTYNSL
jgi:diguanylate cyclase (GGDEF)-like protein/PAS domain S-box-containing protein